MIPPFDGFSFVFPHLWAVGVWLAFLGCSLLYSFFANNQTWPNKINNMRKFALICLFFGVAVVVAQSLQPCSDDISRRCPEFTRFWHGPTIALLLFILFEIGDLTAFVLHLWRIHAGGLQGWIWLKLYSAFGYHQEHARIKFYESLDPAEVEHLKHDHPETFQLFADLYPNRKENLSGAKKKSAGHRRGNPGVSHKLST